METSTQEPIKQLTPAQLRIVLHMVQGKTNAKIAAALHISVKTIKAHVTAIFRLAGCKKDRELLAMYYTGRLNHLFPDGSEGL